MLHIFYLLFIEDKLKALFHNENPVYNTAVGLER